MQIKSQKDFWSGVMFIVVGVAFAVGAREYSMGSSARPGPGYFPYGLGVLLALLGAGVVVGALRSKAKDGDPIGDWAWRPLLVICGAVALFGLLLPPLGMVVTIPILVVVAALGGDEFHWKDALINAAILTAGSWGIFIKGLGLTLPLWPKFITG
jgi:hypothetical protein